MRYISTRNTETSVSGPQAIAQGISTEGGLFVPNEFPELSMVEIASLVETSYIHRAREIIGYFLPEFSRSELEDALEKAYGKQFSDPQIAPVVKLSDTEYMLELWHGPTCAFKDMALQLLPQLLTRSMKKVAKGTKVVILVATSGDTGKAALEGFHNVPGTQIITFYPEGGVSEIQRLQMTTQEGDNVQVFAVEGNFDDTQTAVKEIFTNQNFAQTLAATGSMFSSANSINWGRLMPQIVYYFSAYCDMIHAGEIRLGDVVNVCVPTGNFGNILAAYYAKRMGLPLGKFICASNENHVLSDFFETGTYDANREFLLTNSPSMDILISSNLERLLFELSSRDAQQVQDYMASLAETREYTLTDAAREKMEDEFFGDYLTEEQTKAVIAETFQKQNYLCDTHTAVALGVYRQYAKATGDQTKTIIASTANPYKFADSILHALDPTAQPADEFETLQALQAHTGLEIPPQILELATKPVRFDTVIPREQMPQAVADTLGVIIE